MDSRDPSMTLITDDELIEITGSKLPTKQCSILRENNIAFVKRLDGRPRTTWYNLNNPLDTRHKPPEPEETFPDFSIFDEKTDKKKNRRTRT